MTYNNIRDKLNKLIQLNFDRRYNMGAGNETIFDIKIDEETLDEDE